jgi:hypothetical protein
MIIPWKNDGRKENRNMRLFKIKFNHATGKWVANPQGKYLGYRDYRKGEIVRHKEKETDVVVNLSLGTPSLGIIENEEEE